jgi:hypothetical protein
MPKMCEWCRRPSAQECVDALLAADPSQLLIEKETGESRVRAFENSLGRVPAIWSTPFYAAPFDDGKGFNRQHVQAMSIQ